MIFPLFSKTVAPPLGEKGSATWLRGSRENLSPLSGNINDRELGPATKSFITASVGRGIGSEERVNFWPLFVRRFCGGHGAEQGRLREPAQFLEHAVNLSRRFHAALSRLPHLRGQFRLKL